MKVLQFTQHYPPFKGGIEAVVHELSKRLVDRGHEVVVLCELEKNTKRNETQDGVQIHRVLPVEPVALPYGVGRIAPSMMVQAICNDADVYHVHGYGNFPSWVSIFRTGPTVLTPHNEPIFRFSLWDRLRMIPLRLADTVIVNTTIGKRIFENGGVKPERTRLIPNGITLPIVPGRDMNIHPMILCLARLEVWHKGQDILLRAMREVIKRIPDARLVIAGNGRDYDFLLRLSKSLGIEGSVDFTGELSEEQKCDYLSSCDVLCTAPRTESFGLIYLEAMAFGRPIVTTNVGGIPEVIGDAGILVPPNDPDTLAQAIICVLTDRKLALTLRDRGLKRVKRFDWDNLIDEYVELYETLVR
ncbi:MAG: glycosyltransferase family 4 protein [Thaumarchaeota archaeon]|nr:glycosyltransferase family 4 protein [Nitrososphaerota archaeon]